MSRRGMALLSVVFALLVLGALVAAGFFAALLEQRLGRHTLEAVQAAEAAEAGLALVVGSWETYPGLAALSVGGALALPSTAVARGAAFEANVRRLTDAAYLIQTVGSATDAGGNVLARRSLARLVRVDSAAVSLLSQRSWVAMY